MAGHSKWANIKRQKARVDAKKAQVFARLSRAMIVAARQGLPDPAANFQLRTAIEKAKAAGIPNDNIERAIAKGAGTLSGDGRQFESVRYEGYGPSGIAILIEALTDNRNRTAANLRAAFSKQGGNLGETGCVSWMFRQRGVVQLTGAIAEADLLKALLDLPAESYDLDESGAIVYCSIADLEALSTQLRQLGYPVEDSELRWIPNDYQLVTDGEQARSLLRLLDTLETLEDVCSVTANLELPPELVTALEATL
ncbi:hypothetical protein syc0529_d [Synechococcus elongatus PCC 6301]|uniref:Probable transcriptional regulatory protein syc0529_d n=1 Tax=Synechococcus sp. (strain ATCC 27144 / PCC 6301 / SAUG 1402/1) TaxID=269084 RepID=Y529_SYNP6|nr:YebC/PmpR family DNA-binding transcriptional regulator [Synechococcus elongatus]Q5N4Q0.1 RecName: Full=Probable transcriptional regulatory protein syc0529_d [Synechococcus elongatus PCC 6301]BAD78719.1 hypothetical protein syc0529_d [Synechococcus elongatus PCC 6301]